MAQIQEYKDVKCVHHGCEEWWLTEKDVEKLLSGKGIKKGWLNMSKGENDMFSVSGDKCNSERTMILHIGAFNLKESKLECDAKDPVIVFHQKRFGI